MTLRSSLLSQLPWVEHGFGTRNDALSQDGMAGLEQVHSSAVLVADRFEGGRAGTGDALITNRSGLAVSVRTADCFPILLADVRNHAVAAVHAGWRGTAARIVVEALGRMRDQFGTSPGTCMRPSARGLAFAATKSAEKSRDNSGSINQVTSTLPATIAASCWRRE